MSYRRRFVIREIALGFERLDLVQLRNVMEGIGGYFNGLDGYMSDL